MPLFLTLDDVLEFHEEQLAAHGGSAGVRSPSGLDSAVMAPQASFGGEYLQPDLWHMAAAYAFYIAEAQAFVDGNKRTALHAALVFLDLNGISIDDLVHVDEDSPLYGAMIAVADHRLGISELAALLRDLLDVGAEPGS